MEHFTQMNVFARIRIGFAHLMIGCVIRYSTIGNLRYIINGNLIELVENNECADKF